MTAATMRKGRPTIGDAQQLATLVTSVAREQFIELGYRAVTMRGVAAKAMVSTRTLYNRYADKLSLFTACLELGAETVFPHPELAPGSDMRRTLRDYAAALVQALSSDSSLRLTMLVYREGAEFPELLRAAEDNQHRHLVRPLAACLRTVGLERSGSEESAKLFIAMALSEWQRTTTFRRPLPNAEERLRHAELAVSTFLGGAAVTPGR
jgi:TetR/AcrR family transcriptional regulator, mexJK operon transcriptional repressor